MVSAKVDEAFVAQEIHEPTSRIVKGFPPIMPRSEISDDELKALTAYIKAQGN